MFQLNIVFNEVDARNSDPKFLIREIMESARLASAKLPARNSLAVGSCEASDPSKQMAIFHPTKITPVIRS